VRNKHYYINSQLNYKTRQLIRRLTEEKDMGAKYLTRREFLRRAALASVGLAAAAYVPSLTPIPALAAPMQAPEDFSILLGRPTDHSITVNAIPDDSGYISLEYGTGSGEYDYQTSATLCADEDPVEVVIDGLAPNTQYYYRLLYGTTSTGPWTAGGEHSFHTQRAPGSTFTFTITSDSHVNIILGNAAQWQQTLSNVVADNPDFHLDLGDTFAMDHVNTAAEAEQAYLYQRSFFDLISHSAPIFLAIGNHEQEEGWHLDDTGNPVTSQPVIGANARKKYYPNPVPNAFYSGNGDTYYALDGDQMREDYYAWQWGDTLFIVIDPYWYTTTKPFAGNIGGGESSDTGSGDRWDWTLGVDQFNWFKQIIESSSAKYKFVFAHHMVGGSHDYVRGGAVPAHLVEWGGYDENGTTWGFTNERPEAQWGATPIHQLMVANHVSAFFHGHDHQYAYEERDGVVYQSLPAAGFTGNGFDIYNESNEYTIRVLPSSGHLRVTVSPSQATVDYVRSGGTGGGYTYTIDPSPTVVTLASFTATPHDGAILLAWETASEIDNVGFNLYRSESPSGQYAKLNQPLIPGQSLGSLVGAEYAWLDEAVEPGKVYYYRLEDVEVGGKSTFHGPISASAKNPTVVSIAALGARQNGAAIGALLLGVCAGIAARLRLRRHTR
jgi:hypothetical protein